VLAVKQGSRRTTSVKVRRSPSNRPVPARRRPPRSFARLLRRRRRTIALVASLLLHIVAAFFFLHHHAEPPSETVATVERLSLDRKVAPTPKPIARPPAPPRLRSKPIALPLPLPLPEPLAAPARIARVRAPRKELARPAPHARAAVPLARPTLSDARIARITSDLRAAIASDVAGRGSPITVAAAPIAPPRHYALDASNFMQGDRRSHGLCDPVKNWEQDEFNYYYVACNVRFSDGTFQRQSVPWPVRFPRSDDPFAGSAKGDKPLAMPLPGWHLAAGETVTPELRAYARDHGVEIDGG